MKTQTTAYLARRANHTKAQMKILILVIFLAIVSPKIYSQSPADFLELKGLAPVATLSQTPAGKAALGSNFVITEGIQTGAIRQPTLLPFAEQQQQALRDAFITDKNLAQLADGLGTTLGAAYTARVHYIDRETFTSVSQRMAEVIAYAELVTSANSTEAKYFFANQTTNGITPVTGAALQVIKVTGGSADPFGQAYGRPAGRPRSDKYGNSRPFQTEPSVARIIGTDYFGNAADNDVYNHGPMMDLTDSPSYPSGHTTYGFTGALLIAVMVPERYQQMIARGAEYGNDRIILGAHYAMDVLGGRTLALYDVAHLLANDPAYLNRAPENSPKINDFREALKAARVDLTRLLQTSCGNDVEICAHQDTGRFSEATANRAFYTSTETYGLPIVHQKTADGVEDVRKLAPEAGYLLTAAFPSLSLDDADDILTNTEGPGGGFLDDGSSFGVYSRLNLYEAAGQAARFMVPH